MDETTPDFAGSLRWNAGTGEVNEAFVVFESILFRRGLKVLVRRELGATSRDLHPNSFGDAALFWYDDSRHRFLVSNRGDADALVMLRQNSFDRRVSVDVATSDQDTALTVISEIRKAFPPAPVSLEPILPITFWYCGHGGPTGNVRPIEVARWTEVSSNYSGDTKVRLAGLMNGFKPAKDNGRLLLWHGEPGTGKTFALRALAWAWREWCRFEYVIDPEELFGNGNYLTELILHPDTDGAEDQKWRLLILEDSGEVMAMDAKRRIGQGLSRLLNLSDGILGQGTNILILVTTNEDLGKLNPAIRRYGRCLSEIEYRRFDSDEGAEWLRCVGCNATPEGPRTLSELYAIRAGHPTKRTLVKIGFASRESFAPQASASRDS